MPTISKSVATSKPILYYYLDDGDQEESTTFAKQVATGHRRMPQRFPAEFSRQIKAYVGEAFKANGLILDLRLDQTAHEVDDEKQRADYRCSSSCTGNWTRAGETRSANTPLSYGLLTIDSKNHTDEIIPVTICLILLL